MVKVLAVSIRMRIKDGVQNIIKYYNMPQEDEIELIRNYLNALAKRESLKDETIKLLKEQIKLLKKEIEILKKEKKYD